jgi:hypothetical protein
MDVNVGRFKLYLNLLPSKIPKDMSTENLVGFIQNHQWSLSTGSDEIRELIATLTDRRNSPLMTHFNQESSINFSYRLQRFIHENLAKETKIVIHIVDGIHRVTDLDCALVGFDQNCIEGGTVGQELPSDIINYASVLPHKEKAIILKVYFLPEDIHSGLVLRYQTLSSQIQKTMGQLIPHTLREIIHHEMNRLHQRCKHENVPYLWGCLGVLYELSCSESLSLNIE